jgi:isocitrate/isopropylmalate dehydrogenase
MKVRPALAPVLPIKKEIVGDGLSCPFDRTFGMVVKRTKRLDFIVIRELTGGLYYGEPRGIFEETDGKRKGLNTLIYTDYEIERIARAAFELARTRSKKVTSVAKENMMESSRLWRDVVTEVSNNYPDVELNHRKPLASVNLVNILIDAATNKPASGVGEPCEHTISSEIHVSLM